jgi:LacI family transcriptional regulator
MGEGFLSNRGYQVQRKPTMNDVARLAEVGTMTVSRVLNGSAKVSKEATDRVNAAIEQLNYRPNELARALRGERTRTIGLILPYLYDPFFAVCAHAVSTVAQQRGYSVTMTTSNEDPETEYNAAIQMLQRHVDGLILIPANRGKSRITRALLGRTQLVVFDRPLDDPTFDTVLVQNQFGSRRMVQHLIGHGHSNISFMGLPRSIFTMDARFQGYRKAMTEAGLESDSSFQCTTMASTLEAIQSRLASKKKPTAYFTANTLVTRYVFATLLQLGIHIPSEAAIAGFDDFDLADLTGPPLTVVRQPAEEMGRVAANQLFDRLERGETPQTGNRVVLPVEIVLRRSCGCKHKTAVIMH